MNQNSKFNKNKLLERKWVSLVYALSFCKKIRKRVKKSRYRMNILREWVKTEESYRSDLIAAIETIRDPLLYKNLINNQQAKILCSDFEAMVRLSKLMLDILYEQIEGTKHKSKISSIYKTSKLVSKISLDPQDGVLHLNPNQIILGQELGKIASGYKVYGSFFANHSKCERLLVKLTTEHSQQMKQVERQLQQYVKAIDIRKENISVKDCLQQPVMRLFKYVVLMNEYIKRLPKYHPDYHQMIAARQIFQEIYFANNDLMRKLQQEDKKIKLQKLLGRSLEGSMTYIAQMKADTIQFPLRIYIFNTFVVLSKVGIGLLAKQEKYMTLELDQFSYIATQSDTKYFKHILCLTGKHASVHLFFPDTGSKMQLYNCINRVIKGIRIHQHQKRRIGGNQKKLEKKIKFTMDQNENETFYFKPGFRIEVLCPEVRPLSQITNQTVYITRFMLPQYYDDWKKFIKSSRGRNTSITSEQSLPNGQGGKSDPELQAYLEMPRQTVWLSHRLDLHLSQLECLQKSVKSKYPTAQLPELNPLTKDVNIYSRGRKKTKAYEVRCFFIEEYLNILFRHPSVMANPYEIIKKLRIEQAVWDYAVDRSQKTVKSSQQDPPFGMNHCDTCSKAKMHSLQEFQHYRRYFRRVYAPQPAYPPKEKYCLNFYNIARTKMLCDFQPICFNTLQRVLTNVHYTQGKVDYPFLQRYRSEPQKVSIYLPGQDNKRISLVIFEKTTVGQVIQQIAFRYNIDSLFDFSLSAVYFDRQRILNWDQYVMDVVKQLAIKTHPVQMDSKIKIQQQSDKDFFSVLKDWGRQLLTTSEGKLLLKKHLFLTKELQSRSLNMYPEKCQLIIEQVFDEIEKGLIPLQMDQLGIIGGLYYVMKETDKLANFTRNSFNVNRIKQVMPLHIRQHLEDHQRLLQIILETIQLYRHRLLGKNGNDLMPLYNRILDIMLRKVPFVSYFVPVEVHKVDEYQNSPTQKVSQTYIGVNFRHIFLVKKITDSQVIFRLPINETKCTVTVFSVFLAHESKQYRLDGRMFFAFHELVTKYQLIHKKFPQYAV